MRIHRDSRPRGGRGGLNGLYMTCDPTEGGHIPERRSKDGPVLGPPGLVDRGRREGKYSRPDTTLLPGTSGAGPKLHTERLSREGRHAKQTNKQTIHARKEASKSPRRTTAGGLSAFHTIFRFSVFFLSCRKRRRSGRRSRLVFLRP